MAHISSLGAALYTDLAIAFGTVASNAVTTSSSLPAAPDTHTNWITAFTTEGVTSNQFLRVPNIREFPSIGTPANIVNVPEFQARQSKTVQGQADAPSLEVTINYIPSLYVKGASGTVLGNMVGDNLLHLFRFTLLQAVPTDYTSVDTAHIGSVANSQYFWLGKLEALLVKPDLKDTVTAVLTLSIQSDFYGAFTNAA